MDSADMRLSAPGESRPDQSGVSRRLWTSLAALAASIAVLGVIAAPMLAGRIYNYDDLGNLHVPLRHFYWQCLHDGDRFDWMPSLWCGFYLQGEGQAGMYHPLHLLLYSALPFPAAFNIDLFLTYPLMLAGMYIFLRRWNLAISAALVGAAAFTFSGFTMLHFVHMHMVAVIAHTPWLLVAIDAFLRDRGRAAESRLLTSWRAPLAVCLLTASQLLLGFPQSVWFSIIIEGWYILLVVRDSKGVSRAALLCLAKVCALGLAAVQLLPTIDQLSLTQRFAASAFKTSQYSLHPLNLLQLVAPYLFKARVFATGMDVNTHEYGIYDGAVVLILSACLPFVIRRPGAARRLATGAVLLFVAGLVLAFGSHTPVFALVSSLPLVGLFRAPARYIVLAHFALAVCAAVTFDRLCRTGGPDKPPGRLYLVAAALGIGAIMAAAAAPHIAAISAAVAGGWPRSFLVPALALASGLFLLAAGRKARWAPAALAVLLIADQAMYGISYIRRRPAPLLANLASAAIPDFDPSYYRIKFVPSYTDLPVMAGYRLANGFTAFPPANRLTPNNVSALRVAGVATIVADVYAIEAVESRRGTLLDTQAVGDPLPRARCVTEVIVEDDPDLVIESIDVAKTATVDEVLDLEPAEPGRAAITSDRPGDVVISVDSPSRQLLVFAERFHEGWRVAVDGVPARVVRTYGDFLGCVVESGAHEVRFVFRPESLRRGKAISLATLALAAAVLAGCLIVAHRRTGRK